MLIIQNSMDPWTVIDGFYCNSKANELIFLEEIVQIGTGMFCRYVENITEKYLPDIKTERTKVRNPDRGKIKI